MVRSTRLVALLLALSFSSIDAVILYRTGDPSANTTAPSMLIPHEGWDYEGSWAGFLGTAIAPHFFISAAHIGQAGGRTFTFQSVNYTVLRGFYDPQSDLVIWQVAQTFPAFASLYPRQDEVGQGTVDIGRGTQRATLTYTKSLDIPLSYSVEQSTDLSNWTTASTIDQTISTSGNAAVVKSKVDMTGLSRLFLRVRTTQQ
jgi:hypothetical protein